MAVLTDEDLGLDYGLSDEDVGLGGEQEGGFETWSPEEQARLEAEQGDLAPETGIRAGLRRLRAGPIGTALFGPTQVEREAGAMSTGSPGEIAETALKFTSVPPPLANLARKVSEFDPINRALPSVLSGVQTGLREFALTSPLAPIPVAPRAALGAFSGQYLAELPEMKHAYEEALASGNTKEAASIAAQTVAGGALLGLGGAHEIYRPSMPGGIPEPVRQGEPINAQRIREDTGQPAAPRQVAESSQTNRGGNLQQAASEEPQSVGAREQVGNAPQETSPVLLRDSEAQAKWTQSTRELSDATQAVARDNARSPLDWQSFTKQDEQGFKAVDVGKLAEQIKAGKLTSDSPADALLIHLSEASELHPLESIRLNDFSPTQWSDLTLDSSKYYGSFDTKPGERTGLIDINLKHDDGSPLSQAEFMQVLTHELVHNNITSKFEHAEPQIKADAEALFDWVKDKSKGTEFEKHYGTSKLSDMFSEISEPNFRDWLASQDYSGSVRKAKVLGAEVPAISPTSVRQSALGKFLEIAKKVLKLPDVIKDAFGRKVDAITALDQIVSLSSRLEKVRRGNKGAAEVREFSKAKEAAEKLPPVPDGHVRMFSGRGGPQGGGDGGSFYTENLQKASTFGPNISWVDLPAEKAQAAKEAARKSGQGGDTAILTREQAAQAKPLAEQVGAPVHDLDAGTAQNPPLEFWGYDPMTGEAKWKVPSEKSGRFTQITAADAEKRGLAVEQNIPTKEQWDAGAKERAAAQSTGQARAAELFGPKPSGAPGLLGPREPSSQPQTAARDWIRATESKHETGLGGQLYAGIPNPVAVAKSVASLAKQAAPGIKKAAKVVSDAAKAIYRENLTIRKMNDLDRSVLNWSGKLQRSFGEASTAQKDVQAVLAAEVDKRLGGSKLARVTGKRDRLVKLQDEGLTNWIEAGGDREKLIQWRDASKDPKLRAGYEAALNLTPAEIRMANEVRNAYDILGKRGKAYEVIDRFRDDYVTHIWNLGKGAFQGGSRTLKDQFKFAKARTLENYFQGEQYGMKPKTKRLSQLLPVYLHEMNTVIAARQLVAQMAEGKASDGRPLIAPQGFAEPVTGPRGEATLVKPEAAKRDTRDYKELPGQPALHDWVWAGKDTAGNPVFEKSDLVLHPEAYKKLKAILGKSKIREWYEEPGSTTMAIPKAIAQGLDKFQSETKRTMLGLISPFHQVQEGTHAIGHRINPFFNVPKPNMENPAHLDLAKHGLMITPDRASERNFTEGLRPSGLVSFIPGVGRVADLYSNYLFHEYIPGLKIKTALAIIERNKKVYAKQLASGEVSLEDVKLLSTTQANAAYGHLNYADLGRDPTIQHILQLGLLAPDFLEARGRFVGQALKGAGPKVGREQLLALATLAVAQATGAWIMSKLTDGEWEGSHPFEFRKGNRRYTMRSVPEDLARLLSDTRAFVFNRLNPITGVGPLQFATGRDRLGRKVTAGETAKQLALAPIPLTARGFMGIDKSNLEDWEELAGAAGLKIMRYSPQNEVRKLFLDWKKKTEDPRLVAQAEAAEKETFGESDYSDLRSAMERNNFQLGAKAYEKLLETHTPQEVRKAMNPEALDPDSGLRRDKMLPKKLEKKFLASLSDDDREVYEAAKRQRRLLYQRFQKMLAE